MFIYNGYDFTKDLKVLNIVRPMIAPQKVNSTDINGRSGSIFNRKISLSYEVKIEVMFRSETPIDMMRRMRDIGAKLDSDKPQRLVIKDEPDKYIMAIIDGISEPKREGKFMKMEITFYCPDPYWYAINDEVIEVDNPTSEKVFNRKGSAESYPIIEIKGTSSGGSIGLDANGETMVYSGDLSQGEVMVVDSEILTAYIVKTDATKISILNKLDKLDFPVLRGGQNKVTIVGSNGATVTNYKIYCNSRWK